MQQLEKFAFRLTSDLATKTRLNASRYGQENYDNRSNVSAYGRFAVSFLNTATDNGFKAEKTALVASGLLIPIPSLRTVKPPFPELMRMSLGHTHTDSLNEYARKAGIDRSERMRRSLMFTNFVMENSFDGSHGLIFTTFVTDGTAVTIGRTSGALCTTQPYQFETLE